MPSIRRCCSFLLRALPLVALALVPAGGAVQAQGTPAAAGTLAVTVTGLKAAKGQLIACLWSERTGFPSCSKSHSAHRLTVPVSATTMQLTFSGVHPGRYAVTVEHDENGDGKMGHNFIGMPTEGVGISNNPGGMPGYDKSLINVAPGTAIEVKMRYLFG